MRQIPLGVDRYPNKCSSFIFGFDKVSNLKNGAKTESHDYGDWLGVCGQGQFHEIAHWLQTPATSSLSGIKAAAWK